MSQPRIEDLINFARDAGDFLLMNFRKSSLNKRAHGKDIKTIYDIASEKLIKKTIMKKFPNHSILAEETGFMKKDDDYIWIIDPLDGTSNFVNSNPFFAIAIAFGFKG
ncbi:MAG: inositol monophosphatase family protein, partial [Candidatus Aenigmatarchaeota archaeon]